GGRLSFQDMESPVDESGRSRRQGVDALLGKKDRVTGGFGELLDGGCHVDGVTDEGDLELAAAADGSGDHDTRVDPDADAKLPAESIGDKTLNQHSRRHRSVGVIREIVWCPEDSQRTVAEKLVDMPTGIHDGRHHDLK